MTANKRYAEALRRFKAAPRGEKNKRLFELQAACACLKANAKRAAKVTA